MHRNIQTALFSEVEPNAIPSEYVTKGNIVTDAINSIALTPGEENPHPNLNKYFKSTCPPKEFVDIDAACRKGTLDELAGSADPDALLRCGWMYKKGATGPYPAVSSGYAGNVNGPIDFTQCLGASAQPPANGKWYWDLQEAKKAMDRDRCAAMTQCGRLGESVFQGCGYATNKARGIPLGRNGGPLYMEDARDVQMSDIITTSDKCPPVAPAVAARDPCYTATGKLGRDCMLIKLREAQCSDKGTLYNALQTNTTMKLPAKEAYKVFQARAGGSRLNEQMINDGGATADAALQNFRRLYEVANSNANSGLAYAARDLCMTAGAVDDFDFCTEISDGSRPPFDMKCLQKAFLQKGGTLRGEWYPSPANMASLYTFFRSWGEVLAAWDREIALINTTHPNKQLALKRMMDVSIDPLAVVRR